MEIPSEIVPLFLANRPFGPQAGQQWVEFFNWAKIPLLREVVSLDQMLCERVFDKTEAEDWSYIVNEDFRLDYYLDLDYLQSKLSGIIGYQILGLYRNPVSHILDPPGPGGFEFLGYDLIDEMTQISALTNCGGWPDDFSNEELNQFGLLRDWGRAVSIKKCLAVRHPEEPHAQCESYAVWRLAVV